MELAMTGAGDAAARKRVPGGKRGSRKRPSLPLSASENDEAVRRSKRRRSERIADNSTGATRGRAEGTTTTTTAEADPAPVEKKIANGDCNAINQHFDDGPQRVPTNPPCVSSTPTAHNYPVIPTCNHDDRGNLNGVGPGGGVSAGTGAAGGGSRMQNDACTATLRTITLEMGTTIDATGTSSVTMNDADNISHSSTPQLFTSHSRQNGGRTQGMSAPSVSSQVRREEKQKKNQNNDNNATRPSPTSVVCNNDGGNGNELSDSGADHALMQTRRRRNIPMAAYAGAAVSPFEQVAAATMPQCQDGVVGDRNRNRHTEEEDVSLQRTMESFSQSVSRADITVQRNGGGNGNDIDKLVERTSDFEQSDEHRERSVIRRQQEQEQHERISLALPHPAFRFRYICSMTITSLLIFLLFGLICTSVIYVQHHTHEIDSAIVNEQYEEDMKETTTKLQQEWIQMEGEYKSQLNHANERLNDLQSIKLRTMNELAHAQRQITDLKTTQKFLFEELADTKHRVESLLGTKEDVSNALDAAWERIDELTKEKHDVTLELTSTQRTVSHLEEMKEVVSQDLENALMKVMTLQEEGRVTITRLTEAQSYIDTLVREKENLTAQVKTAKERTVQLQDLLTNVHEDVSTSKHHIATLQNADHTNNQIISELDELNYQMVEEITSLKADLENQLQEAIMAVDAVATAAAKRRLDEMTVLSAEVDAHIEALMAEAVGAVNAVASSANDKRIHDLQKKDCETNERMMEAIHAINAVATSAATAATNEKGGKKQREGVTKIQGKARQP